MKADGFAGYRVLALESRRGDDMRRLIRAYGGEPLVVPSVEERPREPDAQLREFAERLQQGDVGVAIFLTGVGARMLAHSVPDVLPPPAFAHALNQTLGNTPRPIRVELGEDGGEVIAGVSGFE